MGVEEFLKYSKADYEVWKATLNEAACIEEKTFNIKGTCKILDNVLLKKET